MSKKSIFISIGLIIILILGYLAASPYIVLNNIKKSIDANDSKAVASYIDFPSVRQSLKAQLNQQLQEQQKKSENMENDPFDELINLFATTMIDKIMDTMLNPENLTTLLQGKTLENSLDIKGSSKNENEVDNSNSEVSYETSYKSFNRFQVDIKKDKSADPDISVVMTRDGLSWKVTELVLHDNEKPSAPKEVKQEPIIEEPKKVVEVAPEAPKVKYENLRISDSEIGNGDFYLPNPAEYEGHAIFYLTPAGMDNILEQVVEEPEYLGYLKVEKAYKFSDQYLLVVSTGESGNSCPATTYVIGYDTKSHSVSGFKRLESCKEDALEFMSEDNKLVIKKENESFTFYNASVN